MGLSFDSFPQHNRCLYLQMRRSEKLTRRCDKEFALDQWWLVLGQDRGIGSQRFLKEDLD